MARLPRSSLSAASLSAAGPPRTASSIVRPRRPRHSRHVSTQSERLQGSIAATSSGLFKLTLPLPAVSPATDGYPDVCRFALHPKQPLSLITSLIATEARDAGLAEGDRITFHALAEKDSGRRWSSATELGDFVQDAAKDTAFVISLGKQGADIEVHVPSFKERTQHLRERLRAVSQELKELVAIRDECDDLATQGAKRVASLGFAGLLGYWVLVYRLTFGPDGYGWDVMEPVTYLVGLTALCSGYLFFLWHRRDVSYQSLFHLQTSRKRAALYQVKGFNADRFQDLVDQGKDLRRAIQTIAHDYDQKWSLSEEDGDHDQAEHEIKKAESKEAPPKKPKDDRHSKEDDAKL